MCPLDQGELPPEEQWQVSLTLEELGVELERALLGKLRCG